MSIIKAIKLFFSDRNLENEKTALENNVAENKAYYDLLNKRIQRRQDNLDKLQRAVREMQQTFKDNQTVESHEANLKALNAMIDIEENRLVEELN